MSSEYEFLITFLGTSASMPTAQRALPATLIQYGGTRILVDCGEGTQRQMMKHGGLHAPTAIFLTHYHPDHDLGLPGLLASLKMMEHDKPVTIYGPPGIEGVVTMCKRSGGWPSFARYQEMENHERYTIGGLRVTAFRTDHDVQSLGYQFSERNHPGRFDVDKADALAVNPGPDYGKLQRGESVINRGGREVLPSDVIGPARPGRKLVISGDTRPTARTVEAAKGANLLVHEATFSQANEDRAKKVGHSTGREAAMLAKAAGVGKLVLHHFSPRETVRDIVHEASSKDSNINIHAARDGDTVELAVRDAA